MDRKSQCCCSPDQCVGSYCGSCGTSCGGCVSTCGTCCAECDLGCGFCDGCPAMADQCGGLCSGSSCSAATKYFNGLTVLGGLTLLGLPAIMSGGVEFTLGSFALPIVVISLILILVSRLK